jgi:hydrogenase maturation factor HypF (carbamoyltransferase family)
MRLEGYIWNAKPENHFDMDDYIKNNQILSRNLFMDYFPIVLKEFSSKKRSRRLVDLASSMVRDISELIGIQSVKIAQETGIRSIGVTGGVAYNEKIVNSIRSVIEKNGYVLLKNENIPCGDAGISTGQLSVAGANNL